MTELLSTLSGVNVGLMRYSSNRDADVILGNGCFDQRAEGGMVTFAMDDIDAGTNRADLLNIIDGSPMAARRSRDSLRGAAIHAGRQRLLRQRLARLT
jgi:hypothetical protein